jgi:hypothetical protein
MLASTIVSRGTYSSLTTQYISSSSSRRHKPCRLKTTCAPYISAFPNVFPGEAYRKDRKFGIAMTILLRNRAYLSTQSVPTSSFISLKQSSVRMMLSSFVCSGVEGRPFRLSTADSHRVISRLRRAYRKEVKISRKARQTAMRDSRVFGFCICERGISMQCFSLTCCISDKR